MSGLDAVTGAFSYSGRALATELMSRGRRIRTLTGHPDRAPAGTQIEVAPLDFTDASGLARSLEGVGTLYNTYWVRFAHGQTTHQVGVDNSRLLFEAAAKAGVERIVHVSITHASLDTTDTYFHGKAVVEQALAGAGVSYAILRPAVLFGGDGVLLNNIAWLLRHLPIFAIAGDGNYKLRPIHIDDLAKLAADCGARSDNFTVDAVGPDRPTFNQLVGWLRAATRAKAHVLHVPAAVVPPMSRLLGFALRDVLLTHDELVSMMDGRADTSGAATGSTSLEAWIASHGDQLGQSYANEITRHFARDRGAPATSHRDG